MTAEVTAVRGPRHGDNRQLHSEHVFGKTREDLQRDAPKRGNSLFC